ncbi:hypothetical protein N0V90_000801 [Kalmusia sp. IMI 367209]|nr:hypothetical protein N0V90_000801 [Kalmusia sp. IMI 367209]
MSWMDSWSRPSKSQATPPPLYLTVGDGVPYCYSCGRVIGQRKSNASQEVKYCSARCRNHKPRAIDRRIEAVFAALLDGASPESLKEGDARGNEGLSGEVHDKGKSTKKQKAVKGDPRIIVECATVEEIVFHREKDPTKVFGRRKNRAARGVVENPEDWRSVDMVDDSLPSVAAVERPASLSTEINGGHTSDSDPEHASSGIALDTDHFEEKQNYGYGGGKVRPPQAESDINGSVGGEKGWAERIHETDEMKAKRREGERRAEEKEMVKKAARRGVAFGFGDGNEKRKCEAVMKGAVVESSFAKGEWGIRWREKI